MPFAYIPKSLATTAGNQPVPNSRLCAYEPNTLVAPTVEMPSTSLALTNHWVLFLGGTDKTSLRFDPSPTGPDNTIDIIVSSKSYPHSANCVKTVDLTTAPRTYAANITDHIVAAKYDNYKFSTGGQGCRFWLYSFVHLLRSKGFLPRSEEVSASEHALGIVWDSRGSPVPKKQQTGITKGTFQRKVKI